MDTSELLRFLRQRKSLILLALFLLFWVTIAFSIIHFGWNVTWAMLHIPTMSPPFADMRSIQGALFSISAGHNPQMYNPGDPWGRAMNYPSIWIDIAKIFRLGNETNFLLFVLACVLGYLFSCYTLLKKSPFIYMLLGMCSGASLLAVERGNNDLVVFMVVAMALQVRWLWIRSLIVMLAVVLKVYPIFTIYGFFRKNIKVLIVTVMLAAIYLGVNYDQMMLVKSGNTASGYLSYGVHFDVKLIVGLLPVLAFLSFQMGRTGVGERLLANRCGGYERELFIAGGSIYILTFISSINWDYRLIFLLFCLPYVHLYKNRVVSHVTSISVLLSMNVLLMSSLGQFAVAITQISKYYLFAVIFIALSYELSPRVSYCKSEGRAVQ